MKRTFYLMILLAMNHHFKGDKMKLRGKVYRALGNDIAVKLESIVTPKVGEEVVVHFGKARSVPQNSRYWKYLSWVLDNGLREEGCLSTIELHEMLKDYFLSEKSLDKGILKKIRTGTTTDLTTSEFGKYMDHCDILISREYMIDTSLFHKFYKGG